MDEVLEGSLGSGNFHLDTTRVLAILGELGINEIKIPEDALRGWLEKEGVAMEKYVKGEE